MRINLYILIIFSFMLNSLYAEIYKWTDNDGIVHFSDAPHSGAKKINIPGANEYTSPISSSPIKDNSLESTSSQEEDVEENVKITINTPSNEETIRNNQGYVPISATVNPELKSGNLIQLLYDGKVVGKPQTVGLFALSDVARGKHTIAVEIIDADGNSVQTSDEIIFFMHRPYAGMVPGTAPKPSN